MRAVRYGVTRDWVQALEVVLPNGEVVELGRKVVKNATGYSLLDLIIGSEGTLGIITKAVLKLTSKPVEAISIMAPFATLDEALNAVPKIIQSKSNPIAIEFSNGLRCCLRKSIWERNSRIRKATTICSLLLTV